MSQRAVCQPVIILLLLALAGCSWNSQIVRSEEFDRTTTQVGMLEAPTGPHSVGPQLAPGQVALQGALEYGAIPEARRTRAQGASGALLATAWGRGQATVGITRWLQLGVEGEVSPAQLSRSVATDTSNDGWTVPLFRAGLDMRFHFDTGRVGWEPFLEMSASGVRWYRTDTLIETVTTYGERGTQTESSARGYSEFNRAAYISARTGFGLVFGTPGHVQVRGGPVIGNAPWLYGSWTDHWGCDYYADGSADCSEPGTEPEQVSTIVVPGLFANLSVPIGSHIVLNAGGWVDGIPGRSSDTINARPGATASLAFLLGPSD